MNVQTAKDAKTSQSEVRKLSSEVSCSVKLVHLSHV